MPFALMGLILYCIYMQSYIFWLLIYCYYYYSIIVLTLLTLEDSRNIIRQKRLNNNIYNKGNKSLNRQIEVDF